MRLKTCAGCFSNHPPQDLTRGRCPDCARRYDRAKMARRRARRGTTSERGYDNQYRELRKQAIAAHPYCADCGAIDDLTADHVVPLSRGGDPHGPSSFAADRATPGGGTPGLEEPKSHDPTASFSRKKRVGPGNRKRRRSGLDDRMTRPLLSGAGGCNPFSGPQEE
jgi:hypothetical protein